MATKEMTDLYAELSTLNKAANGLSQSESPVIQTVRRFNEIATKASEVFNDKSLIHYQTEIKQYSVNGRPHESVKASDFKQNVFSIANLIHEKHLSTSTLPPQPPASSTASGGTNISPSFTQSNQQSTTVTVEFNQTLITLSGILAKNEADYKDGTPEKSFIEKLRTMLAGAKSTIDVIKLIIALGVEFGLTANQIQLILK